MTKRIFSLEWNDDLGSMWMNKDNLAMLCFTETKVHSSKLIIKDITDEIDDAKNELSVVQGDLTYIAGIDNVIERLETIHGN